MFSGLEWPSIPNDGRQGFPSVPIHNLQTVSSEAEDESTGQKLKSEEGEV